jgi:hypothetical protein
VTRAAGDPEEDRSSRASSRGSAPQPPDVVEELEFVGKPRQRPCGDLVAGPPHHRGDALVPELRSPLVEERGLVRRFADVITGA